MSALVQFPTPTTFRNLATPTDNTDGATKAYVDSAISGGTATANLTLVSVGGETGSVNTSVNQVGKINFDESKGFRVTNEGSGNVFISSIQVANVIVSNIAPTNVYAGQLWYDIEYGILSVNYGTGPLSNVIWVEVA